MNTPPVFRERLRGLAQASIRHGIEHGVPVAVRLHEWPDELLEKRSTFVTLHRAGQLRGCIGALEAARSLVQDVASNAYAAAFEDPRFSPVTVDEFPELDIHVSVLSPREPLDVQSEADLLQQLRPGIDGLVLEDGDRRGTFLPAVWRSLPDARDFLAQLKAKAGFPPDYWSESIRAYRYTAEEF
ncbi:MAG: hypothetical protein MAG794_01522 [Gammaproteobacteria bacterium]|nr:hypothetical protein [Gammaproteobacteria bacterium]